MTPHPGGPEGKVLLPCPFCGAIPRPLHDEFGWVQCPTSNCPVDACSAEKWNDRCPSPALGAEPLTAEVREAAQGLVDWSTGYADREPGGARDFPMGFAGKLNALRAALSRSPAPAGPTAEDVPIGQRIFCHLCGRSYKNGESHTCSRRTIRPMEAEPPSPMGVLSEELQMVAAMAEALEEHFPDHDEQGGIVCRCGQRFPRISATAWHRHAAAMAATAAASLPPSPE